MRILALNPYHGGSHKDFLEGWQAHSRHDFTVIGLRAHKWKWRMRHAAQTLAEMAEASEDGPWDLIFTTDMLNAAELRGLLPAALRNLPLLLYMHENQLTYPIQDGVRMDLHFPLTNLYSAAAADAIWINSAFHRDEYFPKMREAMRKMPDHQPLALIDRLQQSVQVHSPGIPEIAERTGERRPGPLRILWSARWEFDKNPHCFFEALQLLKDRGIDFELTVLGRSTKSWDPIFDRAEEQFADQITSWGFLPSRADFEDALRAADVVVSTAKHEFFGIAVAEAVAAGAMPVAPDALAYPEVLGSLIEQSPSENWLHENTPESVADRLLELEGRLAATGTVWPTGITTGRDAVSQHFWPAAASRMDNAASAISPK
jgi:glycosyltransferase involved in cell wall biosynthesis